MNSTSPWYPLRLLIGRGILALAAFGLGLAGMAPSAHAQLYSQDFSGGTAPGWVSVSGDWTVRNEYYWDADLNAQDSSYYNGTKFDTGFTYTSDISLYGNGTGNDTGVVYYYQNSSNYYEIELTAVTSRVELIEHVNSAPGTVVATGSFTASGGSYQTVVVARSGTTTTIQVNGVTAITRTETALTGGGYIGVCDQFGNVRITNITVADTGSPTVSISAPTNNAQVSGSTTVTANASDEYGLTSVQFQLDGVNLGSPVTSAPYTVNWDTTTAANGAHALTAIATNVGGIQSTSSSVAVTVNNGGSLPSGWSNGDIGSPGAAGSASYSNGTYTIQGSGNGMWGTASSFQYAYTQVTGNCTIIAHVESVSAAGDGGWEHGGVMISDSLSPGSTYAAMYSCPNGLSWEARTTANETPIEEKYTTTTTNPYWIELVRSGDNFTAYSSPDGTTWTQYGSAVSITMGSTVYVGLAVSSEVVGDVTTAVIDNVSISTGPTVSITAPADNAEVSGTTAVTASASSGNGIASVQFQLDGANLGS
ncbi:MAG: Ig-like domain-containing protein, partial [Opitutaceae bacterium]